MLLVRRCASSKDRIGWDGIGKDRLGWDRIGQDRIEIK
jgi:hypothetical protein